MSARERAEKRVGYRHFPAAYTDLLTAFKAKGKQTIGPLTKREANSTRRALYSFFGYLRKEYDTDDYAKHLSDIARDITISLLEKDSIAYIIVDTNPVVRSLATAKSG